jgi:hypothetical protein
MLCSSIRPTHCRFSLVGRSNLIPLAIYHFAPLGESRPEGTRFVSSAPKSPGNHRIFGDLILEASFTTCGALRAFRPFVVGSRT